MPDSIKGFALAVLVFALSFFAHQTYVLHGRVDDLQHEVRLNAGAQDAMNSELINRTEILLRMIRSAQEGTILIPVPTDPEVCEV